MKVKSDVAQPCPTLCNPMDCRLPSSSVHGIFQARVLDWVAISFSNAGKWKVKGKSLSRVWLLVTPWTAAYQAPLSMGFSRQEYWSGFPLPSPFIIYQLSNLFSVFLLSGRILLQRNPPISKHCFTPMKICSFPHNLYPTLLWCRLWIWSFWVSIFIFLLCELKLLVISMQWLL